MKVFVTGGTGFIGSVVVRRLLAAEHEVRCLVRSTSDLSRLAGLEFEPCRGDVCDADSILRGMASCDGVIHLAGVTNWAEIESPRLPRVVIDGTRHILAAARLHGNLRTVFISSTAAINATPTPVVQDEATPYQLRSAAFRYSHAKHAAEELCRLAVAGGVPVVIVNPSEVYGPHDEALITAGNLLLAAASNPVVVCDGGTGVVHVDDVAQGIIAALLRGRPGERYILSSENLTLREIAAQVLDFLGLPRRIVTVPRWTLRTAGCLASWLKIPLSMHPATIPYAARYWFVDNSKARRELGIDFRPARTALFETLRWLDESERLPPRQRRQMRPGAPHRGRSHQPVGAADKDLVAARTHEP